MSGSLLRMFVVTLTGAAVLTACGPGAAKEPSTRAVGYNSALGRVLTASHWCSTPGESSDAQFIELDVRQNGKYIKTSYRIKPDNSLENRSEERGTWAIVGDQFFTRTMRQAQTRQKLAVSARDAAAQAVITKQDPTETCLRFSDAGGVVIQAYCSCQAN